MTERRPPIPARLREARRRRELCRWLTRDGDEEPTAGERGLWKRACEEARRLREILDAGRP